MADEWEQVDTSPPEEVAAPPTPIGEVCGRCGRQDELFDARTDPPAEGLGATEGKWCASCIAEIGAKRITAPADE